MRDDAWWTKVDATRLRECRRRIDRYVEVELVTPCPERQARLDRLRTKHDMLMAKLQRCMQTAAHKEQASHAQ